MKRRPVFNLLLLTSFLFVGFEVSQAQRTETTSEVLTHWISLDAPPGWEHLATDQLGTVLNGWTKDAAGNLILRKGSGSPRRVVACGLDRMGWAVTEITDGGYLRLREAGAVRQHPLWAQFHEGQRIKVLTRTGTVPGVVGVKSTHLQRGRGPAPPTTLDDLWVDVGASSRADVTRMGIELLNPVVRDLPEWSFGDFVSGPSAAARVGCAAVASAARGEVKSGETIFILSTLRSFGNDGLEAALRKLGRLDQLFIVDETAATGSKTPEGALQLMIQHPLFVPETAGITSAMMLAPEARFTGSLVETVDIRDAETFLSTIERVAGVSPTNVPAGQRWIKPPNPARAKAPRADALSATANLLRALSDLGGVSGHENGVRAAILASIPASLRSLVVTDDEGNLILELGPAHDPVMFIAHQDEVGFEITNIADDGAVSLRNRGGLYLSLWEGQPALLHFDMARGDTALKPPLKGVFVPRGTATNKQPETLTAWFGLNADELKSEGVKVGQSVTGYKRATRIGPTRFTARALDDRSGTTALLLATRRINPALLKRRVIFAWTVREETGLEGARVLAKHYANTVSRVYSIDTFVSSDTPLESTRFAFAPLGKGAVIRALDSASVSTLADIDRIVSVARRQAIPLQIGATNGGADGSEFVRYGVSHTGLSWPGRYSHSPVEVLDLNDLQSLERLIYALAIAP
jgi:putative aminopeptidase FrvX